MDPIRYARGRLTTRSIPKTIQMDEMGVMDAIPLIDITWSKTSDVWRWSG